MRSVAEMAVEIVKAQASLRRMTPQEIEEAVRRTAAALQEVSGQGSPAAAAPATPAAGEEPATVPVDEAARRLGVSRLTVYGYIRKGLLRAERKGRSYAVVAEDVEKLRAARRRRRGAAGREAVARRRVRAAAAGRGRRRGQR